MDIIFGKFYVIFDVFFKKLKLLMRLISMQLICKIIKEFNIIYHFVFLARYEQDPSAFLSKVSECVNQSKDQLYNPDLSTADDSHAIV